MNKCGKIIDFIILKTNCFYNFEKVLFSYIKVDTHIIINVYGYIFSQPNVVEKTG